MQGWNLQSKKTSSNAGNISKMLSQIDRQKFQAKTESQPESDYLQKLMKPRSHKYRELLTRQIEISNQMEEIQEEIREMNKNTIQEEIQQPQEQSVVTKAWWEELPSVTTIINKEDEQQKKELLIKKQELEKKYQALKQQLEETKKQLEEELPVASGLLGMIYPSDKQQKLLNYGVIAVPGTKYHSPEELLEQVKPQTQQEKQQWLKANEVYWEYYTKELLNIEIYLYAICVIYENGTSKVIKA